MTETTMRAILMQKDAVQVLRNMDSSGSLVDLEPSLAALRMPLRPGYHHKDNLTHSLQVLENAISREPNEPDLIVRTAALFHDIGKPATRKFGKKGEVTFEGHETVGSHMVRRILKQHGYTKPEISEISKLVAFHMRSHGYTPELWTDSAVRRLITDVGDETSMNRLFILFYSDVTTKYDSKRERLHQDVDNLRDAVMNVTAADARKALRPAVNGNEIMARFNLTPGPQLGAIMKWLNSDEGIHLTAEEAYQTVEKKFFQ